MVPLEAFLNPSVFRYLLPASGSVFVEPLHLSATFLPFLLVAGGEPTPGLLLTAMLLCLAGIIIRKRRSLMLQRKFAFALWPPHDLLPRQLTTNGDRGESVMIFNSM